nr:sterol C-24 reductase [Tanacetum cinerariifolium]
MIYPEPGFYQQCIQGDTPYAQMNANGHEVIKLKQKSVEDVIAPHGTGPSSTNNKLKDEKNISKLGHASEKMVMRSSSIAAKNEDCQLGNLKVFRADSGMGRNGLAIAMVLVVLQL